MDGLSSASAIIAVGSFAIQLAETVQKLHLFWRDIQDAPSDVAALFNELESLLEILLRIRGSQKNCILDVSSSRVLKDCENKILLLHSKLIRPLSEFKSPRVYRRKWSALKITLEKPLIESARNSIEKAKATLTLALFNIIQYHHSPLGNSTIADKNRERLEDQHQLLVGISQSISFAPNPGGIQASQAGVTMQIENCTSYAHASDEIPNPPADLVSTSAPCSHARSPVVVKHKIVQSSKLEFSTPLWLVKSSTRSVAKNHAARSVPLLENVSNIVIYPSKLLSLLGISSGISLQMRSMSGWQLSLQPFNAVAPSAPIFEFCRDGNVAGIRTLLSTGHASLRDRDPDGRTPLWIAARSLQHEVVTFLLEQGADADVCDWRSGRPPISAVCETLEIDVNKKVSIVDLLHRYSPNGYDEDTILRLTGLLLLFYRPRKKLEGVTMRGKSNAALHIIKQLLPFFPPDDIGRTRILHGTLSLQLDQHARRWTLQNIQGPLHDTPNIAMLHEVIAREYLFHDIPMVRMVTQKTRNLHRRATYPNPVTVMWNSTPTTIAMYQRKMFNLWRSILQDDGHNFQVFVEEEIGHSTLAEQGWTRESLQRLFDFDFGIEANNIGTEPPSCERCSKTTERRYRPVIDLDWRRQLRDIRLGVLSSTSASHTSQSSKGTNISITFSGSSSCDTHIQLTPRTSADAGSVPYNMVCSDACEDGVCVAWIYETDSLEEPVRRPYVEKAIASSVIEIHDGLLEEEEKMNERQSAGRRMPGSFED